MSLSRKKQALAVAKCLAALLACILIVAVPGCGDAPRAGSVSLSAEIKPGFQPITIAKKGTLRPPARGARP